MGPYTTRSADLDLLTTSLDFSAVQDHATGLLGVAGFDLRFTSSTPVSAALAGYLARTVAAIGREHLPNGAAMAHP